MMKYLLMVVALMMMSGCERETDKQTAARYSEKGQYRMDIAGEVCKKGVVYYVTYYDRSIGIAPAFNPNSTIRTCTE